MAYTEKTQFVVDFLQNILDNKWDAALGQLSTKSLKIQYFPSSLGAGGQNLVHTDPVEWKEYFCKTRSLVADFTIEILDTIESDSHDRVMVHFKSATGKGAFTGTPYNNEYVVMCRLATEDGNLKMTEMKEFADSWFAVTWLPGERKAQVAAEKAAGEA